MPERAANLPRSLAYGLEGRIVTMDPAFTVYERGTLYVREGHIAAIVPQGSPIPPELGSAPVYKTRGTIYPGLIELHNHLSYNALPPWRVPRRYSNRDQWGRESDYRRLISGPMKVLGSLPEYVAAVVRYVEGKCLLSGVTTTQGIALYSNQGIQRYYRGLVRNVEQTDEAALPEADSRIADVEAVSVERFWQHLQKRTCLLLHLSEGTDASARRRFTDLRLPGGAWAVNAALTGIHCVGLQPDDFHVLAERGAAMVWSPLSNLLLYGQTADLRAARDAGLPIGLGSDWSPSGSKNLLFELKVARLASDAAGGLFADRELVAMATSNAAAILRWEKELGSLEAGKRADLLVLAGRDGDPYAHLIGASEGDIHLVVIEGAPRFGAPGLMERFAWTERWKVGKRSRLLNLSAEEGDPAVGQVTLRQARDRLRDALARLPELAAGLERSAPDGRVGPATLTGPGWFLMLEQEEPEGIALETHFAEGEPGLALERALDRAAPPLSAILEAMELDPLTVADDARFVDRLTEQINLPEQIKVGLRRWS